MFLKFLAALLSLLFTSMLLISELNLSLEKSLCYFICLSNSSNSSLFKNVADEELLFLFSSTPKKMFLLF